MEIVVKSGYPYPFKTDYTELEFDDVCVSDKVLCIGAEVSKNFKERFEKCLNQLRSGGIKKL